MVVGVGGGGGGGGVQFDPSSTLTWQEGACY